MFSARGVSMLEVIVASAISLLVVVGGAGAFMLALPSVITSVDRTQAAYLAEEGLEVVRILRDSSWSGNIATLAAGTPYYLSYNSGTATWSSTTTNAYIGKFERSVTLAAVNRDASQNIVTSGGSNDTNTRKATVTVSWLTRTGTTSRSLVMYLTNVFNN
jgi:Tfp pilus assembly protein PilV